MTKDELQTLKDLPKTIAVLRKVAAYADELRQLSSLFGAPTQAGQGTPAPEPERLPSPLVEPALPPGIVPGEPTFGPPLPIPAGVKREVGNYNPVGLAAATAAPPVADPEEIAAKNAKLKEDRKAYLALLRKSGQTQSHLSQFAKDDAGDDGAIVVQRSGLNVSGT